MSIIADNIEEIRKNIEKICLRAGRNPKEIQLIAVSKTFGEEKILEAMKSGIVDFGENYVQEILEKQQHLQKNLLRWHFIGHLQSNKVKYIIDWVYMIHSVESETLAKKIQKRAEKIGRTIPILVEVNTSEEATKFGARPEKAVEFIRSIAHFPNLEIQGLMTIGPFTLDVAQTRTAFQTLKSIFNEVNAKNILSKPMQHLSMGMTHDYEIAIEEGATMLRIGTAIFGKREKKV